VKLSRSRPFHKNDNRNVVQKNSTRVRACLGYDRLDSVAQALARARGQAEELEAQQTRPALSLPKGKAERVEGPRASLAANWPPGLTAPNFVVH